MPFRVRPYTDADAAKTMQLFYNTVHQVNKQDYSPAQLDVWASKERDIAAWNDSLLKNKAYVVVTEANEIVGFADLAGKDYFDRLYVHHAYQKQGIATRLAEKIEACACAAGATEIFTDASITARPFFEKHGYVLLQEQTVMREEVPLTNYKMRKIFSCV